MEESRGALDVDLSHEGEREIRRFVEANEVSGPYLPPEFASYNYTDTREEN